VGPLTVTDTLPAGETLAPGGATGTDWSCGLESGGQFTCITSSGLAFGSYAQSISVPVNVAASQTPGTITNTASVTSGTNNPDPDNATSHDPTTIVTSADLALSKVHLGPSWPVTTALTPSPSLTTRARRCGRAAHGDRHAARRGDLLELLKRGQFGSRLVVFGVLGDGHCTTTAGDYVSTWRVDFLHHDR